MSDAASRIEPPEIVFYDGNCGLCHGLVRFLLARDRDGRAFRFAPLFGETFDAELPHDLRETIPDSLVVKTRGGKVLLRSEAALHTLRRLGGAYAFFASLARVLPLRLRDWVYDGVAAIRHKLFPKPENACPVVPRELRSRFLA